MANRIFTDVKALNKNAIVIAGSFEIAASGGAATRLKGLGFTVAKSATGVYDITLNDAYSGSISINSTVQAAVAVDLRAHVLSETVATTKIVQIALLAGATATEPSAVTVVNFTCVLSNTSLPS